MWIPPRIPDIHRYATKEEIMLLFGAKPALCRERLNRWRRDPKRSLRIAFLPNKYPARANDIWAIPVYHLEDVLKFMIEDGYALSHESKRWLLEFMDEGAGRPGDTFGSNQLKKDPHRNKGQDLLVVPGESRHFQVVGDAK